MTGTSAYKTKATTAKVAPIQLRIHHSLTAALKSTPSSFIRKKKYINFPSLHQHFRPDLRNNLAKESLLDPRSSHLPQILILTLLKVPPIIIIPMPITHWLWIWGLKTSAWYSQTSKMPQMTLFLSHTKCRHPAPTGRSKSQIPASTKPVSPIMTKMRRLRSSSLVITRNRLAGQIPNAPT